MRTYRLLCKIRYLLTSIRSFSHPARTPFSMRFHRSFLNLHPPSSSFTRKISTKPVRSKGRNLSLSSFNVFEDIHTRTRYEVGFVDRFYSSSGKDVFKAEPPIGVYQRNKTSVHLNFLRMRLGESFKRLSRYINLYFRQKDLSVSPGFGQTSFVVHEPLYRVRHRTQSLRALKERGSIEDSRSKESVKLKQVPETSEKQFEEKTWQQTYSGLQLFHISSLATRFGESYSYVANHINSVFSKGPTHQVQTDVPLEGAVSKRRSLRRRKQRIACSYINRDRETEPTHLNTNQNAAQSKNEDISSWDEGYLHFARHINQYFGAKVSHIDEVSPQQNSSHSHSLSGSVTHQPTSSMSVDRSAFENKQGSTPIHPKTPGLFHLSNLTTRFGENYTYMANHINQYFKGEDAIDEVERDAYEEGIGPSVKAEKPRTFLEYLVNSTAVIPNLVGSYLGVGPKSHSNQSTAAARLSEAILTGEFVGRRQAEEMTRVLLGRLEKTKALSAITACIEELNRNLILHPACKAVVWQENSVARLLRLRRSYGIDQKLQRALRETLALIGYPDPVKGRGIRVLSIDGGGTRGVVPLQVLRLLEAQTGKRVHQLFDYICGVSTGAVLAFMLGLTRISLEECEDLYRRFGSDVFRQNPLVGTVKMGLTHSYYNTETWEMILKEKMGDQVLIKTAGDELSPKVSAVSAVVNWGTSPKAFIFRNYNHAPGKLSRYAGGSGYQLWQAIRASSAAPGYFQEYTLHSDIHQDGGLLLNNPCALAVHECRLLWPRQPFQCVLSLGTAVEIPLDIRQPPTIIKQSVKDHIVEPVDPIIVECEATGNPKPVFTWTKDGKFLNVARDPQVTMRRRSGTLEIFFWGRPQDYEGVYQCTASNEYGSALSNKIHLRVSKARTWLKEFLEPVDVFVGHPLILPCNPPVGPPKPYTYWMNSSMIPIRQDRRVSMAENGDLYFSSVTAEDALTNYVCTARFPYSNTIQQKSPVILQVLTARMVAPRSPKFMTPRGTSSTKIAMLGEELILECIASGVPAPFIKWTKDWEELPVNGMKLENFNKTLRIKKVALDDGGDYICTASNRMGSLDHTITVRVKAAPFWLEKPENLVLARDESGQIVCRADGVPRPKIRWMVNGEDIESAPQSPGRQVSGDTLIFHSVVPDSTAVFQCNASNQYGYLLANAFLTVVDVKARLLGFRNQLVKVTEGSRTLLDCPFFGSPKPELRWSKGGLGTLEGGHYKVFPNGTLEIKRTKIQDQGTYVCIASNVIGRDEGQIELEVKEPTKIMRGPHNVVAIRGSLARFECKFKHDPTLPATVTWLKDKKFLIMGRRMTRDDDGLSIADVYRKDEGTYTCSVKTELEEKTASARLTVMDRPDPPTDLELSDPSERNVRLTWTPGPNNHSPIKEFLVQASEDILADYWLLPSGWKNLSIYPGNLNSVILQLSPFTDYQFRVIAINAIGPSRPSKPSVHYQTGGAVPDAIPKNIRGLGYGLWKNNMEISWEPIEYREWNGPNLRYMVWWRRRDSREEWKNITTKWLSHIIYDTDTFTPYEIKVQAINDFGYGPESPVVIGYSGEDRPSAAPTELRVSDIESTKLTVHWHPVAHSSIMGELKEYKVYYWRESSRLPWHRVSRRTKSKSFKASGPRLSGVLTGLIPYSNYRMYIVVANNRFEGPPSTTIEFQTLEGVPSIPRSFRIMHRHYDIIYLEWEEPAEPNGILTGYILKYQTLNATQAESLQVEYLPPNVTSYSMRRFDRYTRYKFSLAAQTQVGVGEAYTEESPHFTTEEYTRDQVDLATQGWFIGLMCAIALLVLIMLIVFFIKRSRGGKYPVRDKKDLALEPVDEKEEGSFDYRSLERITRVSTLPYTRREEDSRQGRGQGPVEHSTRRTESDDSLMDYGDEEEAEFNEDGSFIGQYTGTSKKDKEENEYRVSSEATSPVNAMYSLA
ncbi:neurofascin [Chanos chanos]|uniref:Neural cell adhesion molecule L1 n=1 Tax=Chanos chanos TaxID=29144 RepID=A0A6J2US77_CHACN|nr:neurofascin-like [Chanos chanos]